MALTKDADKEKRTIMPLTKLLSIALIIGVLYLAKIIKSITVIIVEAASNRFLTFKLFFFRLKSHSINDTKAEQQAKQKQNKFSVSIQMEARKNIPQ